MTECTLSASPESESEGSNALRMRFVFVWSCYGSERVAASTKLIPLGNGENERRPKTRRLLDSIHSDSNPIHRKEMYNRGRPNGGRQGERKGITVFNGLPDCGKGGVE